MRSPGFQDFCHLERWKFTNSYISAKHLAESKEGLENKPLSYFEFTSSLNCKDGMDFTRIQKERWEIPMSAPL